MYRRHVPPHQRTHANGLDQPAWIHQAQIGTLFMPMLSYAHIYQETINLQSFSDCIHYFLHLQASTVDASQYWSFTHEYSLWNATVAVLQFWMTDLKPHILSNVIDQVHTAFFYGNYTKQMQSLPEETLFSHFVSTLNNAFKAKFAQEDEGYESRSESFNIPSPLSRALRVYYVSTMEELSSNPTHFRQSLTTPEHHERHSPWRCRHHSITCHWLVFTSSDDESPVKPSGWHCQHSSTDARSPVCRRAATTSITTTHPHPHPHPTQNN